MVTKTYTVAFEGVTARQVEVQCTLAAGLPSFAVVGLPDKAVSEAKERVRAALETLAIALPSKKITINLSPADLPKEGSHFDLPIALALLAAIEVIPADMAEQTVALGELSLDGRLIQVSGALPAAMTAAAEGRTLLCPAISGPEAAWVGDCPVIGAADLGAVLRHFTGQALLEHATPGEVHQSTAATCLRDVRGQERAKRALEIAAAGRHHLLMIGTPGAGKSMLAERLPTILPPLSAAEALETSMIHSVAGLLKQGGISRTRPFRAPHHTASMAAMAGGGKGAKPGEMSLAHNGVLFMDEFPEFPRNVLETLRQPIETGQIMVARANAHTHYPCRFMLVAAANPCRCGYLTDAERACTRVPKCGQDYMAKVSGPLMDRFDMRIEMPPVSYQDLTLPPSGDTSATVAQRVAGAWSIQSQRYQDIPSIRSNAECSGAILHECAAPDPEGAQLLHRVAEKIGLSARGYHRILRVARTIADLDHSAAVRMPHIAEAVSYRLTVSPDREIT
ncbi:YifB family Mg chelatase-like AAA ATPase [Donghicola mangrovi]|uniref:YifB family Mg chelatase-like AAA ATPase n=1 Tax=Donghicola mangrovi TaxID=2729614 RepID=A0A850Q5E0_9RHOB|nr:YifB family Mg chelatase-like AAA ATPase [Donghicola mangrovi]NVO21785.1 YifB family Mg chelatase-like AAA ATPase [Donghicola mangrovi]